MKRIFQISALVFLFISFDVYADNNYSKIISEREQLIQQYDSIKIQLNNNRSWNLLNDLNNLFNAHDAVVKKDDYLIDEFKLMADDYETLIETNTSLKEKQKSIQTELDLKNQWLEWGMYGCAGLGLILLIFFILFLSKALKAGKLKKQLKKLEKLHEEYQERLEIANTYESEKGKLAETEAAYSRIIEENNIKFENEKANFNKQLTENLAKFESLKVKLVELEQDNSNLSAQILSHNASQVAVNNEASEHLHNTINEKDNEIGFLKNRIVELERDFEAKDTDTLEKFKTENLAMADEMSDLRKTIEEERSFNHDFRARIEALQNELSDLRNRNVEENSTSDETTEKNDYNKVELLNENNSLKEQVEEYKKILNEELEFRKDILKLIEELKRN